MLLDVSLGDFVAGSVDGLCAGRAVLVLPWVGAGMMARVVGGGGRTR